METLQNIPLAERIRPKSLEDYISQRHLVGEHGTLLEHIQTNFIPSLILWGPPGTGKNNPCTNHRQNLQKAFSYPKCSG